MIEKFEIIQERLVGSLPSPLRLSTGLPLLQRRGLFIMGPRGVGKTTFVVSASQQHGMFYLSCDHPLIATTSLWDLASDCFSAGYDGIVFDEVHFAKDWSQHIKAIYDSYPNKRIWILDSLSLSLKRESADLSRRFIRYSIPLLSFREYMALREGIRLPLLNPFEPDLKKVRMCLEQAPILRHFRTYLREGSRPFFLEGDFQTRLLATIEKTLIYDIPFLLPGISDNIVRLMRAIVGHLSQSTIPTINVDALCRQWAIGKEKLYRLLNVMEEIGLLHIVRKTGDRKALSKGAKLLFQDPAIYPAYEGPLGNMREALVVSQFKASGKKVTACKNEKVGDFRIGNVTVEIGGRDKARKKSDWVIRDDVETPTKKIIPLWVTAMMY